MLSGDFAEVVVCTYYDLGIIDPLFLLKIRLYLQSSDSYLGEAVAYMSTCMMPCSSDANFRQS